MPKACYHHGQLRGALLDAAETLVRERGVDGWSLREASARVGVSPSAAYHHFASRDALVRALSERVLGRLGERVSRAAAETPDPGTDHQRRLVAVGRAYVRWALEDPSVATLAFRAGATGPETSLDPHPHDVLAAELDHLTTTGGLPPRARPGAEFVLWSAVHGLATLLADGLIHLDDDQAVDHEAERVVRATLTGLAHETTTPGPTPHSAHTKRLCQRPGSPGAPALHGGA
ncbi:TetR/AcrR family transcriptional regulator [Streptomyces litchfieldiae]|uniref:TetR/AcrR family transcriptional regulator n=1 Tax=Streptomyces litchfieldiae TaxID=3075543 RepID=A0ABU2MS26_9ACTN|nr:TetR/AcrR family transcriptional regulator [Streptomyces sp. DSM 44938]MDT0344420.1 TetR/AcrR family transcriptional regulator [Streptomyces sp. DSM 44938]